MKLYISSVHPCLSNLIRSYNRSRDDYYGYNETNDRQWLEEHVNLWRVSAGCRNNSNCVSRHYIGHYYYPARSICIVVWTFKSNKRYSTSQGKQSFSTPGRHTVYYSCNNYDNDATVLCRSSGIHHGSIPDCNGIVPDLRPHIRCRHRIKGRQFIPAYNWDYILDTRMCNRNIPRSDNWSFNVDHWSILDSDRYNQHCWRTEN